ncbi:MAG: [FeFe] hydrogenase H-cluster radical SAM maturase HydE, partial [Ruminococcus sp.]|nr:[FeFe] hydrogenase H-cluster radical SAM maturase HydE [Ruminococcus sp.]
MSVISKIASSHSFSDKALLEVLSDDKYDQELFSLADEIRRSVYGTDVYTRGLIEFTNYCKNDCLYCGIRRSNSDCDRYRLTKEDIYGCCAEGYSLGFRTFVLQGGEDMSFKDDDICEIVYNIKSRYPECAVTLSIGERSRDSYSAFKSAGADRYLLRHETANAEHYSKLHPQSMSLENRKNCLFTLKELGYQVGSGFMVGSPFQTLENLVEDFKFLQTLGPDMIGIGPFISHK